MTIATATTIKISPKSLNEGVVVIGMKKYREIQMRLAPVYYLKGKKALAADKLVKDSLRDHKAGKTFEIRSLADLR
ncbi:MAG TPA: hypothetical protein VJK09_00955 [Candidatus Paceibacterota bacterium]